MQKVEQGNQESTRVKKLNETLSAVLYNEMNRVKMLQWRKCY